MPTKSLKLPASLKRIKARLIETVPGTRFQVDWSLAQQVPEPLAKLLLRLATVDAGNFARLVRMEMSRCRANSKKCADRHGWDIWTGLALSDDGCWWVHSWCRNTRGRIVETTILRTHYFGALVFSGEEPMYK